MPPPTPASLAGARLLLVDSSAVMYRYFFAFSKVPYARNDGRTTTALFGFAHNLISAVETYRPAYVAVAFDSGGKTFRHEMYPSYKAHRPPRPPALHWQFTQLEPLTRALGLAVVRSEGFEADDVLATLTTRACERDMEVDILSGDKDLMQLLGPRVRMIAVKGGDIAVVTPQEVRDKFGVEPTQLRDLLGLAGDAADGIPGVRGVGVAGAAALLRRFGSVAAIRSASPQSLAAMTLPRNERKALDRVLASPVAEVDLSLSLASVRTDVPSMPPIESLAFRGFDASQGGPLAALLEELGMRRTLARLRAYAEAHGVAAAGDGTNPPASEPASALASDPAAPAP